MYTNNIMSQESAIFEELGFDAKQVKLPEGAVVYAIARTYGLIMRKLSATYRRFGLSPAGFNLLLLLERGKDRGSFTQRKVGQCLVVSPSDMSGLVDRMERRGLVRRAEGKDRRSHLLQITPKGSALVEKAWPHHSEAITQMNREIRSKDVQALLRVLGQLRAAMGL